MATNRSAPASTITPVLVYDDVAAVVEWLCRVCGFRERLRFTRDGIVSHAQLSFAEGSIMLGRQGGSFQAPKDGPSASTCSSRSITWTNTSSTRSGMAPASSSRP
jgi:uncharacterized glyoxalase superfamily protein PhnB